MHGIYALMKARWFVARPDICGAHAIALTGEGKVVLVKLRYAGGWRVPGGAVDPGESFETAALRELREEIGLIGHGSVELGLKSTDRISYRNDTSQVFIVRDVEYAPRWSWEIEAITEAPLDRLPPGTSQRTRGWLAQMAAAEKLKLHCQDTPR